MKQVALFCLLMMVTQVAYTKHKQQHGKWYCDFKKTEGSEYEIVFHLALDEGWYVSAEENDEKGIVPPTFTFDPNGGTYSFNGGISPKGIMETKNVKRHGLVNIYSYNAVYIQKIFARPNTKVSGHFVYQFFNGDKVHSVQTDPFEVVVK